MSEVKFQLFISYVEGRERPVSFETNRRKSVRVVSRPTEDPCEKAGLLSYESACTLRKRKLAVCGRSSKGFGVALNTVSGVAVPFRHWLRGVSVHCFVVERDAGVFFTSVGVVHLQLASGKATPQPLGLKKQLSKEGTRGSPVLRTNDMNVCRLLGSVFYLFAAEDDTCGVASVSLKKADHRVHNRIDCSCLEVSKAKRKVFFVSKDMKLYTCSFAHRSRELLQERVVDLSATLTNILAYQFTRLAHNGDYLALASYSVGSNPQLDRIDLLLGEDSSPLSYQVFSPPELNDAKKSLKLFALNDPADAEIGGEPLASQTGTNYITSLVFKRINSMNLLLAACRYFGISVFHVDGPQLERLETCDIGITESSCC